MYLSCFKISQSTVLYFGIATAVRLISSPAIMNLILYEQLSDSTGRIHCFAHQVVVRYVFVIRMVTVPFFHHKFVTPFSVYNVR